MAEIEKAALFGIRVSMTTCAQDFLAGNIERATVWMQRTASNGFTGLLESRAAWRSANCERAR